MKILLNNEEYDLPGTVIISKLQPRIDEALTTYKEWPVQKRLMLKTGIRTLQAFLEMQLGLRLQFPDNDDFIVMLLENLPTWIEQLMEKTEIDATSDTIWTDPFTRYQSVTGLSLKLSH